MSSPGTDLRLEVSCAVNLSEDRDKVGAAITNVFPGCAAKHENYTVLASSEDIKSLERLRTHIRSGHSQRTYRRILDRHTDGNSTWLYLNKQAAFAKRIAVCEQAAESPLGPIRADLFSSNVSAVIEWLTGADLVKKIR